MPLYIAAPLLAQLHDAADVLGRRHDARLHVRLLDPLDARRGRGASLGFSTSSIVAVGPVDVVLHGRARW